MKRLKYYQFSFTVTFTIYLLASFVKWDLTWILSAFDTEEARCAFLVFYFFKEFVTAIIYYNHDQINS